MNRDNHNLYSFADLKAFGINPLTGEACAYARRMLCDLSEEGVTLLTAYLGLRHTAEARHAFPRNMNEFVGDRPAIAGVMLTRETLRDLMVFALWHVDQYDYVLESPAGYTGFNEGDKYGVHYLRGDANGTMPQGYRLLTNCAKRSRALHGGDRNGHAMSGRVL